MNGATRAISKEVIFVIALGVNTHMVKTTSSNSDFFFLFIT